MNEIKVLMLKKQVGMLNAIISNLERLSADLSSPASGSRSREAVRKPDATTSHTTAPPFPDQAEAERRSRLRRDFHQWKESEEGQRLLMLDLGSVDAITAINSLEKAFLAGANLYHPRLEAEAQSGEGGNEVCVCANEEPGWENQDGIKCCALCAPRGSTLSERERSGSGNAKEQESHV